MSEKVLFEMRVNNDENGMQVEINAAPEWREYQHARRAKRRPLMWRVHCEPEEVAHCCETAHTGHPTAANLHRALESLQGIYDDLYGSLAETEAEETD